jgi:hypothetical protein
MRAIQLSQNGTTAFACNDGKGGVRPLFGKCAGNDGKGGASGYAKALGVNDLLHYNPLYGDEFRRRNSYDINAGAQLQWKCGFCSVHDAFTH